MVKVRLGGMAPMGLPEHDLDEMEVAFGVKPATPRGKRKASDHEDEDLADLIPKPTTSEEAFAKFHGKYAGRAK